MQDTMTTGEHIVLWAENSAPHARRLNAMKPGHYTTTREYAYEAFKLASNTAQAMVNSGDLRRMDLEAGDILEAARIIVERVWQ